MHVRHVEESTARRVEAAIGASGDGFLGKHQRQCVGGEGVRAITENVARELIEDDDLCQATVRAAAPGVEFATAGRSVQGAESRRDQAVERELEARELGGASKKMITERLRQLEERSLVSREVLDTSPVSVHYEITELGRTALGFLDELRKWSENLPAEARRDG